jgi:hypothetical protein
MLHTMNSTLAGVLLLRAAGMGVGGCFMPGVQAAVANPQLYSQLLRNASC